MPAVLAATLWHVTDPAVLSGAKGGTGEGKQVSLLLGIARDQVDEAFRISELLETKARNLLQASTLFFAGSQAAIGIQIAAKSGKQAPTWMAVLAVFVGVVGLLAVARTAVCAVRLQEPSDQKTVSVEGLCVRLLPYAEDDDSRVPKFVMQELASIVRARREKNAEKVIALEAVQFWAFVALGSSATALLLGLITAYSLR